MHHLLSMQGTRSLSQFRLRENHAEFFRQVMLNPKVPPLLRLEAELQESVSDLRLESFGATHVFRPGEGGVQKLIEDLYNGFSLLLGGLSPAVVRSKALQVLNVKGVPRFRNHWAFLVAGKRNPRKKDLQKMLLWLQEFQDKRSAI
jgi:hypothetical protein